MRHPIQERALELIHGERERSYGPPEVSFAVIGRLWAALLGVEDIPPERVGLMMTALKLARENHRHGTDNLTDAVGFLVNVARVHEARQRENERSHR